jgi:lipopolysaccharide/colanic/teichoic acid biosynthesis glycosyltransferase
MYAKYYKRALDFTLSLFALIVLSPVLLILIVLGAIFMGGNPFFIQERPGKNEIIFKLIKFRSMDNRRDKNGNLLPDDIRLNKYGRLLRSTSLDELPELVNILIGDMSIVGPRPLLVEYLPYYTKAERKRHQILPGLTGLAQINGRNTLTWEEKFAYDITYVENITLWNDIKIIFKTVQKVFKRSDILVGKEFKVGKLLDERRDWIKTPEGAIDPTEETYISN